MPPAALTVEPILEPSPPRRESGGGRGISRGLSIVREARAYDARTIFWLVTLLWAAQFAVRLAAPPDLMAHDQERPAAYVLDAVLNEHWVCQRDQTGDVMSKPPLFTWLEILATLLVGQLDRLALYLPSGLAVLGTAWAILLAGSRSFGRSAAALAAVGYLLSGPAMKQMTLARTDPLLTLLVTLTALAAFQAASHRRSWAWFWLLAAFGFLTKGPLALLGAGGLLALAWERYQGRRWRVGGGQWLGVALFVTLVGGWILAAYLSTGQDFVDKMFGKELVGHATDRGRLPGSACYKPTFYFLTRFAPWSLLAGLGLWRVFVRPAGRGWARRAERFAALHFLVGIALFSLSPHVRDDHLFPVLPAAALLAGRELVRLLEPRDWLPSWKTLAAIGVVWVLAVAVYDLALRPGRHDLQAERALAELSERLEREAGADAPLIYTHQAPYALQWRQQRFVPSVAVAEAARRLAGDQPAFVVVGWDSYELRDAAAAAGVAHVHTLLDTGPGLSRPVAVLGNRPTLAAAQQLPPETRSLARVGFGRWILGVVVLLLACVGFLAWPAAQVLRTLRRGLVE